MSKHSHYHKDVTHLKSIDVYRTLELFGVTDQALGHAIKKLLCAGQRGAGKTFEQDVREAVDTLNRRLQMLAEDDSAKGGALKGERLGATLRAFDKATRPTWATHMVLDGFNETHYVQACADRPGSYVSLNEQGEVAQLFTHHSIMQIHPLPWTPPVAASPSLPKQYEHEATHRDGGGNRYRQDPDGRWMRWGNNNWFTFSADPKAVPEHLQILPVYDGHD